MIRTYLAALAIPGCFYGIAVLSAQVDRPEIGDFAFERHTLQALGDRPQSVRNVHPGFERIAAWVSAVGAGVALFDLDGDGRHNDYCLVDPRFDSVTVAPVPTTGNRFAPFSLSWEGSASDPGSVAPMGCLPLDADQDGRQDLVVYYWGRSPSLHLAAEDFAERDLLARPEVWNTNAAITADFDGDGILDLFFGNYFPDDMAVLGTRGTVHMQRSMSRAYNAGRNRLLLGHADPSQTELLFQDDSGGLVSAAAGNNAGWTLAAGAADIDGDGLPELFVANDFGPDQLLHNRSREGAAAFAAVTGQRGLATPRSRTLGRDSFKGMGVDFSDIDRDGNLDLYVSNIAEDYALMESHLLFRGTGKAKDFAKGRAPFEEISGQIGVARSAWGWDARIADFNNDGVPEILQATGFLKGDTNRWPELHEAAMANDELLQFVAVWPKFGEGDDLSGDRADTFFVANADATYRDMAPELGFEPRTISRGIALGDVDGDGDIDALIARQWMDSILLLNTSPSRQSSAVLDLRIETLNGTTRPAIGAQVTLSADGSDTRMSATVSGGNGHSGKSAPELHFGLGAFPQDAPLVARVIWRDGMGTHRSDLPVFPGHNRLVLASESAALSMIKDQ